MMPHSVLLVDDDVMILEMFRRLLRREAFEVEVASRAVDAFHILQSRRIAVVVSDENMPGMSGTELLARIQLEYPETIRMMLTGQGSLDVAMRAINEGQVYRFLLKPVRASELGAAIRDALREWELRHSSEASVERQRRREAEVARLEREWHGLTRVERDDSGAIVVPDEDDALEDALRDIEGQAEIRGRR